MRSYYVLRHLARDNSVSLLAFRRQDDPPQALAHLEAVCQSVYTVPMQRSRWGDGLALLRSFSTSQPFLIVRDEVQEMVAKVKALVGENRFDAIHADQLWMAQYGLLARQVAQQKGERPRLVLDQHNAMYLIPQRMAADARNPLARVLLKREARVMARYEVQVIREYDRVVWVTAEDRQAVERHSGALQPERANVIPICIDSSQVTPVPSLSKDATILFVGGMHWPPNADGVRWFVSEVYPRVRAQIPGVKFCAVGKAPPEEINGVEGVEAPGYVEDVDAYWAQSRLFVVPLRAGGGMRVKILDAWARRLPIVSTTIGAEGLVYQDGTDIWIADAPEQFAERIVMILQNEELAQRIACAGRTTVEEYYDWRKAYAAWERVYGTN
jgi:glycosyltransferase involved in cell wall biosynthesis